MHRHLGYLTTTCRWIVLTFLGCLPCSSYSSDNFQTDRLWPVIIGVDQAGFPTSKSMPDVTAEVERLAKLFRDDTLVPTAGERLVVLHSKGTPATAENIRSTLTEISNRSGPNDVLLLAWMMSGRVEKDGTRWFPTGADPNELARTTLLSGELFDLLAETRCGRLITLMDVAFPASPTETDGSLLSRTFGQLRSTSQAVLAFGVEQTLESPPTENRSRQFWDRFARGLEGSADRDGGEADGWICARELKSWMEEPSNILISGGLTGTWLFRNPAGEKTMDQMERLLDTKARRGMIDPECLVEARRVLKRMPRYPEDRAVRRAAIEFVRDETSAEDFADRCGKTRELRFMQEVEAENFARVVTEAWRLVGQHHLDPTRANRAVVSGLEGLTEYLGASGDVIAREKTDLVLEAKPGEMEELIREVRLRLGRRKEVSARQVIDVTLSSMMESLDPYSEYWPPEMYAERTGKSEGHYCGIGIRVRPIAQPPSLLIEEIVPGSPADRAGVKAGSSILELDGKSVREIGLAIAPEMITGPAGEKIRLAIALSDGSRKDMTITREEIEVESVVGKERGDDGQWNYWVDQEKRIGYARLTTFAAETPDRLRLVLRDLQRDGMEGFILDLRFNPGGLMPSSIAVADLFLSDQPIVKVEGRSGNVETIPSRAFGTFDPFPIMVLVNDESASGSEIVAAALQDGGRARVAGSRTYGKASVQNIVPMKTIPGALKVTSERFLRPSSINLERYLDGPLPKTADWGVRPDPGLEITCYLEEKIKLRDDFLHRPYLRGGAPPSPSDHVLARAVEALTTASP